MRLIRTGKKGISTIIANVLMIAIMLSIAAVVVFWAQSGFGTYSSGSQMHFNQQGKAAQERFVIENVFFNATYTCDNENCNGPKSRGQVAVFVRNVGQEEVQVVGLYINATLFKQFNSTTTGCQPSGSPPEVLIPAGGICEFTLTWPRTWGDGTLFYIVVASGRGNQARYQGSALGPPVWFIDTMNKTSVTVSTNSTSATTYTTPTGSSTTIICSAVTTLSTSIGSSQKASTFTITFSTSSTILSTTSSSIYPVSTTTIKNTVTSTSYTTTKIPVIYTTTTTITSPVSSTSTYTTTFMVTSTITSDPIFTLQDQIVPEVTHTSTTFSTKTSTASTTTTSTFSSPTQFTTTFTTTYPSTVTVTTTSTGQTLITSKITATSTLTSSSATKTTTQTSSTTSTVKTTSRTTIALTKIFTTTFLTSKKTSVTSTITYTTMSTGTTSLCTTIITKLGPQDQLTSSVTVTWPSVDWFAIMPLFLLGLMFASKAFRGDQEHVRLRRMSRRRNRGS